MSILIDSKFSQEFKCVKFRIITKVFNCFISINKIEQQCVVLKFLFQSLRLKDHMKTIDIDQSLSNSDILEHRFF